MEKLVQGESAQAAAVFVCVADGPDWALTTIKTIVKVQSTTLQMSKYRRDDITGILISFERRDAGNNWTEGKATIKRSLQYSQTIETIEAEFSAAEDKGYEALEACLCKYLNIYYDEGC